MVYLLTVLSIEIDPFNSEPMTFFFNQSGCISLLLSRLPKLLIQCSYSNGPGNLDNLGSNKEIQSQYTSDYKL